MKQASGAILIMTMDETDIREHLRQLVEEHRDLDDAIIQMADNPATDHLKLRRLKKRKLRLKDQIARYESRLIPDLGA
jgi:hypothetical protein